MAELDWELFKEKRMLVKAIIKAVSLLEVKQFISAPFEIT